MTLATAVAVEEIFASIDVERRLSFPVQRTESDELGGAVTCRAGVPVLLPQIIEQRLALFEFFDVLAHGAFSVRKPSVGEGPPAFPGKDGGWKKFFSETQGREDLQNRSKPRQKPSTCQPVTHAGKRLAQKGRG